VKTCALNLPGEWRQSDHCRRRIEGREDALAGFRVNIRCLGPLLLPVLVRATQTGRQANSQIVRETTGKPPGSNYEESRVPPCTLPAALAGGGQRGRTPEACRRRRSEIVELFRANGYGRSPGRPDERREPEAGHAQSRAFGARGGAVSILLRLAGLLADARQPVDWTSSSDPVRLEAPSRRTWPAAV
jgi:hypothetical protein